MSRGGETYLGEGQNPLKSLRTSFSAHPRNADKEMKSAVHANVKSVDASMIGKDTERFSMQSEISTATYLEQEEQPSNHKFVAEHADEFDVDYSISHQWRNKHRNNEVNPHHHLSEAEYKLMSSFEGLDYDVPISDIRIGAMLRNSKKSKTLADRFLAPRWILTALIGCSTGAIGFVVDLCCEKVTRLRLHAINHYVLQGELMEAYGTWLGISFTLALISTLFVNLGEPVSAGSGIPEVKGYLNGANYMRFLSLKTAVVKVLGIVNSVSAGFVIGKEGPLIHIGSAIGANFATLPGLWRILKNTLWPLRFRNDRDKRDFVSSGAAAGVAVAFGSPTGGLCFALEEASTFWQLSLTWRTYFCTMLATSTLWLLQSAYEGQNNYYPRMKYGHPGNKYPMIEIWQFAFIIIPALFGGLGGAAFCEMNKRISIWRKHYVQGRKPRQIAQVLIVIIINVSVLAILPKIFDKCNPVVPNFECDGYSNKYYCGGMSPLTPAQQASQDCNYTCADISKVNRFICPATNSEGTPLFSSTATLSWGSWDDTIKAMFHDDSVFDKTSLAIFCLAMFLLANITYGLAVPSGLFVPCILMGAAFGRLQGEVMRDAAGAAGNVHPGAWAMLGAAAMLAGVTRITITITVILFETTGQWALILPTMAIVIMAKSIADQFNISLYDMHVELKCIPFVEPDPPSHIEGLMCGDVMHKGCVSCNQIATVHDLIKMLQGCRHNGFPCLADNGKIRGIILRNQIITILKYLDADTYITREQIEMHTPDPDNDWKFLLPYEAFATSLQSKNMRVKEVERLLGDPAEGGVPADAVIDLRPYMNRGPIVVTEITPILRVYGIVRGMGTRHTPVVNDNMEPIGMITRKELMSDFQKDLM